MAGTASTPQVSAPTAIGLRDATYAAAALVSPGIVLPQVTGSDLSVASVQPVWNKITSPCWNRTFCCLAAACMSAGVTAAHRHRSGSRFSRLLSQLCSLLRSRVFLSLSVSLSTRCSPHFETGWWKMLEDEDEQKYPFLLVFIQFCGLGEMLKYVSLADTSSATLDIT